MDILKKLKVLLAKVEDVEEEIFSLMYEIETEIEEIEDLDALLQDEDKDEDDIKIGLTD